MMTEIVDHNAYIDAAPGAMQPLLNSLRSQLANALPDAEEIIAYKMPGFSIEGKIVAGYAAFTKQCGLYVSPGAIADLADQIAEAGLKATKTGVTFSPNNPIPEKLVRKLAAASRKDNGF